MIGPAGRGSLGLWLCLSMLAAPTLATAQPPDVDAQPPDVDAQPPDVDAQPPDVDAQPPDVDAQPPDVDAQPPDVDAQPPDVDAQPPDAPRPEPTTDPMAEIRERVARALRLYDERNFVGALAELEAVDASLPADHPGRPLITYHMARSHEQRFAYDRAVALYERYLREAPEGDFAPAVRAKLETLGGLLGTVRIEVAFSGDPAPWTLLVDGERELGEVRELVLPAGPHRLEVRAAGYETGDLNTSFAAGEVRELSVTLRERFEGLPPEPLYATLVAGGVFAASLVGFGVAALVRESDLMSCDPACVRERVVDLDSENAINEGLSIAADVSMGLAIAAGVTAFVLAFLTGDDADERAGLRIRGLGVEALF